MEDIYKLEGPVNQKLPFMYEFISKQEIVTHIRSHVSGDQVRRMIASPSQQKFHSNDHEWSFQSCQGNRGCCSLLQTAYLLTILAEVLERPWACCYVSVSICLYIRGIPWCKSQSGTKKLCHPDKKPCQYWQRTKSERVIRSQIHLILTDECTLTSWETELYLNCLQFSSAEVTATVKQVPRKSLHNKYQALKDI